MGAPERPSESSPWRSDSFHLLAGVGKRTDKVSIDRLKVAITEGEVQVAVPPRRGRPPNNPTQPMLHEATAKSEDSTQKTTTLLPEDKPSYAEITSRSGRTIKPPDRLMY